MLDRPSTRLASTSNQIGVVLLTVAPGGRGVTVGVKPRPTVAATGRQTWEHTSTEQRSPARSRGASNTCRGALGRRRRRPGRGASCMG